MRDDKFLKPNYSGIKMAVCGMIVIILSASLHNTILCIVGSIACVAGVVMIQRHERRKRKYMEDLRRRFGVNRAMPDNNTRMNNGNIASGNMNYIKYSTYNAHKLDNVKKINARFAKPLPKQATV